MPPLPVGRIVDAGYERVTLNPRHPIRWWYIEGDEHYRFARGGLEETVDDCLVLIEQARRESDREKAAYRFRPTHLLGHDGSLIPIPAELPPELAR